MPTHSNFAIVHYWEHLGDKKSDIEETSATWVGDQTTVKDFNIDGVPEGEGYLLIQADYVDNWTHKVLINGQPLGGMDLPPGDRWQTWMEVIHSGRLKQGNNTIQIKRDTSTTDNFKIKSVAIHWTES